MKKALPNIILVFVLISAVLVVLHLGQTVIDEGVFLANQNLIDQTDIPNVEIKPTLNRPTPTMVPFEDA